MVKVQAPEYPFRRTGKHDRLKEITISGEELFALEARGISPTFIDWARVREVLLSEYEFHTERSLGGLTARDALHMLRARKPDLLIYGEGANGDGAPLTDSQRSHVFFAWNIHKIKATGCSEKAAVQFASLVEDWLSDGPNALLVGEHIERLFHIADCLYQHSGLGWLDALETVIEHEWLLRLKARTAENTGARQPGLEILPDILSRMNEVIEIARKNASAGARGAPPMLDLDKSIYEQLNGRACQRKKLADIFRVSERRVADAVARLKDAGLIEMRRGLGYYRPDAPPTDADVH
ncbi:MAG: hypothetical protein HS116_15115 [Planctomycetes bacterium]|nr:hypothetical protein [Planctomycetota bacterium]